ncbi:phage tail tube protein [Kitasatospora mediocidica]
MIPLAVNAGNLVLGPARMYIAPFGSTEPTDASVTPNGTVTPPSSPWTDVGGTDGGVMWEADNTYTALTVDQVIMDVGARLTEMKFTVTVKLSEMTLANLQASLNNIGTTSSGSGYSTLDINVGTSASQPSYAALIIDGWAPMLSTGQPALRRVIVRKVLSQVKAQLSFDKKTQQSLDCTFQAYFVSSSIVPVHIVDQTA